MNMRTPGARAKRDGVRLLRMLNAPRSLLMTYPISVCLVLVSMLVVLGRRW